MASAGSARAITSDRNARRALAAVVLALCSAGCGGRPAPRGAQGPFGVPGPGSASGFNVLLVTLDTTRADHLGCYGFAPAQTPVLDELAAQGVRYAWAFTAAPVTLPAHATILTGLLPGRHGVRNNAEYRLGSSVPTLATRLDAAGYDTAAFVSSFVLDARFGLGRGFAAYDDEVETTRGSAFAAGNNERRADATTDAALAWLARERRKPFFAWVHYFDAHAPYSPPPPVDERFADRPYDGEIAFVDAQLGRLLGGLGAARERTLVVVVGDHGESLGEHGEATHGVFVYDAVMRVPLLVSAPGLLEPRVVQGLVATADLTPTLLDLLGLEGGAGLDGSSWSRTAADRNRRVYLESLVPYLDYGWAPLFAVRRSADKYILAPRPEYYDLVSDAAEGSNLLGASGAARGDVEALAGDLRARRKLGFAPAPEQRDPEAEERLRALGYTGGAGPGGPEDLADLAKLPDPKDRIAVAAAVVEANARLMAGRPRDALALAEEAARASPEDRTVLQLLAKVCVRLGDLRRAEAALRAFRAIRPKADASLLLAQILILDGRTREAGELLDEAARLDDRHGGVLIARGDILLRAGKRSDARAAYRSAAAMDPYRASGAARARLTALDRKEAAAAGRR